jgi:hypothetical protein
MLAAHFDFDTNLHVRRSWNIETTGTQSIVRAKQNDSAFCEVDYSVEKNGFLAYIALVDGKVPRKLGQ